MSDNELWEALETLIAQWRTYAKARETESRTDTRQREVSLLTAAGCYFNCADQLDAILRGASPAKET